MHHNYKAPTPRLAVSPSPFTLLVGIVSHSSLCEMELPSTEEIVQLGYDVWVSLCDLYPLTLFLRTVVSQHGHEGGSTYIEGAFCILTPPSTIPQLLWPCMYTTTV